jgi:hypothetical protein
MSVKISKINGQCSAYNQKEFLLSDILQVALLPKYHTSGCVHYENDSSTDEPCGFGSIAKVVDKGVLKHFILTPDNKWVEYTEGSVNSGGGGSDPSDPGSGFIEL